MSTDDTQHTHRLRQTGTGPALRCIDHSRPLCDLAGWWADVFVGPGNEEAADGVVSQRPPLVFVGRCGRSGSHARLAGGLPRRRSRYALARSAGVAALTAC